MDPDDEGPGASQPNSAFGFNPSNFSVLGDLSDQIDDVAVSEPCELDADEGVLSCADSESYVFQKISGEPYSLFLFKSFKISTGGMLSTKGARIPIIAAFEDIIIEGGIEIAPGTAGGEVPTFAEMGSVGAGADGGNHCGLGGWGQPNPSVTPVPEGFDTLAPLSAGRAGVDGPATLGAGLGGGTIQLVAGGTFTLAADGFVTAPGGPGLAASTTTGWPGGGGAGGGILIEANVVVLRGTLAANGGGGGGQADAADGAIGGTGTMAARGGAGPTGFGNGGDGSSATEVDGKDGSLNGGEFEGGGGGGAGRIRINTTSAELNLDDATLSPSSNTRCATVGTLG